MVEASKPVQRPDSGEFFRVAGAVQGNPGGIALEFRENSPWIPRKSPGILGETQAVFFWPPEGVPFFRGAFRAKGGAASGRIPLSG
jgi:hypothetical protein